MILQVSGFPFTSQAARQRLRYLAFLGTIWTVTRLVSGNFYREQTYRIITLKIIQFQMF